MSQPRKTLLDTLDRLPPFGVFALARKRRRRPRLVDLVASSGLSQRTFCRIARKITWSGVKAADIDAFCSACGVNILRPDKHINYLKHTLEYNQPMSHLSAHQFKTFLAKCEELRKPAIAEEPERTEEVMAEPVP